MTPALIGRDAETGQLGELLDCVRAGEGRALALTGDPGAGKTVLLESAIAQAAGMTVLTARGVPSESHISFSGLLELLRPVLVHLTELPDPQAAALAGALALGPPVGGDRFAVYAATLSLLARVAQDQPVLAVIDDVHWLDPASAEAVRFAARRLGDERVGMLFAMRTEERGAFDPSGIRVLDVGALGRDAALALLPAGTATVVADEILRATAHNALALVEIPALLTQGQLEGREPLDDPLRTGARAERAFLSRVASLPDEARSALLLAAASGSPDLEAILPALAILELDPSALEAAEAAGLIVLDRRTLQFRHPLVRSTVYHGVPAAQRRAAHRALAQALEGDADPYAAVRRAWHLAAATLGPDPAVADQLDAAAQNARERAGYAEAAAAFERAAELTPPGEARARRGLRAAEAWQLAGRSLRAVELIDQALPSIDDPLLRASAHHLGGRIDIWRGPAIEATGRLVAEAERIEAIAPELAAHMLADAVTGSVVAAHIDEAVVLAHKAHAAALRVGGTPELLAALQLGKALVLYNDATGDPMILRYEELMGGDDPLARAMELAHCVPILMTIEAYDAARAVLDRLIRAARGAGAFGLLAYCLGAQAEQDMRLGNWSSAYADGFEAVDLAREAGQIGQLSYNLARLAWIEAAQGRDEACRAHTDEALELAAGFSFDSTTIIAEHVLAFLDLGLGQPEAAVDRLRKLRRTGLFSVYEPNRLLWRPDLIEASVRSGRLDEAQSTLAELGEQVDRTRRPLSLAVLQRCRGMLAGDDDFAAEFDTALRWHEASPAPFERARTELCYGERLRRARRRVEARAQLRSAVATFDLLGAQPWAERARGELRASGERVRTRNPTTAEQLTAQELQVARIVAEGATNREAAAALFVSPKTIEAHLQSAYRKLGVRSRTSLAHRLRDGEREPDAGARTK